MIRSTQSLAVLLAALAMPACAVEATDSQAPVAAESSDLKAGQFVRLGRTTPAEVVDAFVKEFNAELDEALKDHPGLKIIKESNLYELGSGSYVSDPIQHMMGWKGVTQITVQELRNNAKALGEALLKKSKMIAKDGYIYEASADGDMMLDDVASKTLRSTAVAGYKNPNGLDLSKLSKAWEYIEGGDISAEFLLPVVLKKNLTARAVAEILGEKNVSLVSQGKRAIDDFFGTSSSDFLNQQSEEQQTMTKIKAMLKKVSFKNIYYLHNEGDAFDGWTNDVLVVVDKNNQAFGLSLGQAGE